LGRNSKRVERIHKRVKRWDKWDNIQISQKYIIEFYGIGELPIIYRTLFLTEDPIPSKPLWDVVQGMHPKTLLCSIVTVGRHERVDVDWINTCSSVSNAGWDDAPLNLRIVAWHEDIALY
jgi:hypothetical protein